MQHLREHGQHAHSADAKDQSAPDPMQLNTPRDPATLPCLIVYSVLVPQQRCSQANQLTACQEAE